MADFIVIWKPTGWPHAEILRLVNACQKRGAVDEPWRFKSHRLAKVGDRVFALKQGDGPKSIFGVGSISSEPFRGRATTGKYQWLANVRFTNIVDPLSDALIPEEIVRSVLPNNLIRARSSGMPIENSVATELLKYLVVRPDSIGTRNAVYVTWREGEARGCTDVLALELFQYEGSRNGVIHQVRGRRGKFYPAMCNIKIHGRTADVHYEFYPEFNSAHGMQLGVMRVEFRSSERVTITKPNQIKWKEPGDAKFSNFSASVEIALDISQHGTDFDLLDIPTPEGRRKLISHLSWERDRGKSLAKKNMVLEASGRLLCEACGFDFSLRYGALGTGYCEVHHEIPGSKGERKTKFKDLRILCSNCHRMIHKTDPMMSVEEFASKYIADAPHAPEN